MNNVRKRLKIASKKIDQATENIVMSINLNDEFTESEIIELIEDLGAVNEKLKKLWKPE
jgi:tellurite resistance protein